MTKKRQEAHPRQPTKRQVARWQREKRRQRIIFSLVVLVVVSVVSVLGVGYYLTSYRPLHETVLVVNGTRFDMGYFVNMLKLHSGNQSYEAMVSTAGQVADLIERNELIRQGAAALGIEVSDSEVDAELAKAKPPLGKDYRDMVRAQLVVKRLQDEHFETVIPASANQRQVQAMFLESESQALDVRSKVESGTSFSEPAGQLSLDAFTREKKGELGWRTKEMVTLRLGSAVLADFIFGFDVGKLSQPILDEAKTKNLGYWVVKIVLRQPEPAVDTHVQAMLLGSEEQAKSLRARVAAGEDFTKLASEFSQLDKAKETGGDLGWVLPGMGTLSTTVDDYLFKTEPPVGTLSDVIRDDKVSTKGGYWLVRIAGQEDNRKIDDEDRQTLKNQAIGQWMQALRSDPANKIENFLDAVKTTRAVLRVTRGVIK